MSNVDLHSHSTASDGTLPPREVVRLAKERGLSALALTDHDTIGGIADAADEARKLGIDFLPGIEISCEYAPGTMHILGYGIDPRSPVLTEMTERLIEGRDNRNPKIIEKLQSLNVAITMDEVEHEAKGGVIGRPHIAAILVRKGYVSSIKQAFNEYLAPGGKAYFDKERLSSRGALGMIRESGGLPVLAHAIQLRTENDSQLETVIKNLLDQGLAGIEVLHSDHSDEWVEKCTRLADRHGLLKTGGSDFHGGNKKDIDLGLAAGRRVPRAFYDALVARLQSSKKSRMTMSAVIEELNLPELNAAFETTDPEKIVSWAAAQFGDDLIMSSSFGAESALLLHMATRILPNIKIVFVDTGYLFPETHQFMEQLRKRLNLNVWTYRTKNDPITYLHQAGEENPAWRKDIDACCAANKNEPFERALKELKPKAWLRGTRRDQAETRKDMKFIQWAKRYDCYSISPILNWKSRDIFNYLKKHDLPFHPLYEKGYASIGCNPLSCTQSIQIGEDARSGRWAGKGKVECGINLTDSQDSAQL